MTKTSKKMLGHLPITIILILLSGMVTGWLFNQIVARIPDFAWMEKEILLGPIDTSWKQIFDKLLQTILTIIMMKIRTQVTKPLEKSINMALSTHDKIVYGKTKKYEQRMMQSINEYVYSKYKVYSEANTWSVEKLKTTLDVFAASNSDSINLLARDRKTRYNSFDEFKQIVFKDLEKKYFNNLK